MARGNKNGSPGGGLKASARRAGIGEFVELFRLRIDQYSFGGSIWLRRRLWLRFTAAASLRLRSAVGFS